MTTDEKDSFIQYLGDKVNTYELDKRAIELAGKRPKTDLVI